MKKLNYLTVVLVALISLTAANSSLAQSPIPKRLIKKSKAFVEDQIIPQDKAFLDQLDKALLSLTQINQESLNLINSTFPVGEKDYRRITKKIRHCARRANSKIVGPRKASGILSDFIRKFLPRAGSLQKDLHSLITNYKTCQKIDNYIGDELKGNLFSEGAYLYYQRCVESFENTYGENFAELFRRTTSSHDYLRGLARNHKIKELKSLFPTSIYKIETAQQLIRMQIANKIELSNHSWAKQVILNALTLLQKQLVLNRKFNLAVSYALGEIPTPKEARLPDFSISSIELVLPDKVKVGTVVTIIAKIKNEGDLATQRSRALIIFPNGSQKGRPVPKLLPQQSAKVSWRYKLRHKGEHEFNVIANYNQRAWETNPDNNITKRTLVMPRCKKPR